MMGRDDNKSFPLTPFLSFDSFQSQYELKPDIGIEPESRAASVENLTGSPKPLECLHEPPIPPFLSKTYDLVDDHYWDPIISWGDKGVSFVVWDPVEFARMILPRNFKHNNFSSFVRQLNTYGFRKIDAEKWEFANQGFVRGQKHLLKKIQRRKSLNSHHIRSPSGSSNETALGEIEILRKERKLMLVEVLNLQRQQQGTIQHMEIMQEKIEEAEKSQKQMVSSLAKMLHKPTFLDQRKGQKSITSPISARKFVKHQAHDPASSPRGQLVKYQDMEESPLFDAAYGPSLVEDGAVDEMDMVHELLHKPEEAIAVPSMATGDPLVRGKGVMSPQPPSVDDHLSSLTEDMVVAKNSPEFSMAMEDVWGMGIGGGVSMSSSVADPCGDVSTYNVPCAGSELSDIWDNGAGNSSFERWLNEDSTFY